MNLAPEQLHKLPPNNAQSIGNIALFRTEHSRALENREQFEAISSLKALGLLIPYEEISTVHGRVSEKSSEEWNVDPGIDTSARGNAFKRTLLYTGPEEIAFRFGSARVQEEVEIEMRNIASERLRQTDRSEYLASKYQKLTQRYLEEEKDYESIMNERAVKIANGDEVSYWEPLKPNSPKKPDVNDTVWTDHKIEVESYGYTNLLDEAAKQELRTMAAKKYETQIHDIISTDTDASILDLRFNTKNLDPESVKQYVDAMNKLFPTSTTESIPVSRGFVGSTEASTQRLNKFLIEKGKDASQDSLSLFTTTDLAILSDDSSPEYELDKARILAFNSRALLLNYPASTISSFADFVPGEDGLVDVRGQTFPVSGKYIATTLKNMHAVGLKSRVRSATLNDVVDIVGIFDLLKVGTVAQTERYRNEVDRLFTSIGQASMVKISESDSQLASHLVENPHIKPEKIVALAMMEQKFSDLYNKDAGNWEGYSVAEHTETTLRNLEHSFADEIPTTVMPLLQLALLTHDIGKGLANTRSEAAKLNEIHAKDFLKQHNFSENIINFITTLNSKGMTLASEAELYKDFSSQSKLENLAHRELSNLLGRAPEEDEVSGYFDLARILFICDGGAYTGFATSRQGRLFTKNEPSFDATFDKPVDLSGKRLRLKS